MPDPQATPQPPPHLLSRRLGSKTCAEIAEKYRAGATTPSLCAEYGLSKGGLLRLLHERGVEMRSQPLAPEQLEQAATLYSYGFSIAAIASYLDTSYNNVRQNLARVGIERRPRGGSRPATDSARARTLDEHQGMTAVLLYMEGRPLDAVAAAVGASTSTVREYLTIAGTPVRPAADHHIAQVTTASPKERNENQIASIGPATGVIRRAPFGALDTRGHG